MSKSYFVFECQIVAGRSLLRASDGEKVMCRVNVGGVKRSTAPVVVSHSEANFVDGVMEIDVEEPNADQLVIELVSVATNDVLGNLKVQVADYLDREDVPAGMRLHKLSRNSGYLHVKMRLVERHIEEEPSRFGALHFAFVAINAFAVAICVTALIQSTISDSSWSVDLSIGSLLPRTMIGVAVVSLLAAVFAIGALAGRTSTMMRTFYYLTVCLVLLQVIVGAVCIAAMDGTETQMDHGWDVWRGDAASREKLHQVQIDFQCCGFNDINDRSVDPCPNVDGKRDLPGCRARLDKNVDAQLRTMGSLGVVLGALQLIAIILAFYIAKLTDSVNAAAQGLPDTDEIAP